MDKNEIILKTIDEYAKVVVGVLCKRVEVLEKEDCLKPSLYKALIKEEIYELFRHLRDKLEVIINIGTIQFKEPKKDE